nr:glutaminase a [Quercus suber]
MSLGADCLGYLLSRYSPATTRSIFKGLYRSEGFRTCNKNVLWTIHIVEPQRVSLTKAGSHADPNSPRQLLAIILLLSTNSIDMALRHHLDRQLMSSTLLEEPWPCQQSMDLYVPMCRSTSGVQYCISLNDLLHNMPASRKAGRHTECSRASRTLDMSISAVHIRRLCDAASTFSPLRPPAIPLAVKSPYLNTILRAGSNGGDGGYLPGAYPVFWAGQTTGWTGFIRVDNTTYTWLGASDENNLSADQTSFEYTPTRSIFTLDVAGLVTMTVTFLSGVTPDDLVRSSLPYSYMDVQVLSQDGSEHIVQLYTDVSAGLLCPASSRLL